MQKGDLVRVEDNKGFTFRAHANMPGIYLGRREDGLHVIMMSDRRIYFPQIEGNFAKVEESCEVPSAKG
mgnify:CR=1 FL=1